MKYLCINATSENCNSGEATLNIQDTYDATSTTTQIMYRTDNMTIPSASFAADEMVILEIEAIAPSGTALSEPALAGLCVEYTAYQVMQ